MAPLASTVFAATLAMTSMLGTGGGPVTPDDEYVVIASRRCRETDGWSQVAAALAAKHACDLLIFDESPDELHADLVARRPRLVGVVAMPDEAGRARVGEIHRLLRQLDDDPYLDARWGMVTGASWADAMEIVRATRPLEISKMLANTPVPLEVVPDAAYFDEGVAGRRVVRLDGGQAWPILGDPHTADDFARTFDRLRPDLLVTSGRTNEERWMIGHTFDGGRVIAADDGGLRARTPDGVEVPIHAEGPMAMLGAGSCLLGFIPNADVLPLRFVRHAGARQIVGYCSTTWHGAGGWDLYARMLDEPGRHDLATNAWLAQQDLVRRFDAAFPGMPVLSTAGFDERAVPEFRQAVSDATGMPRTDDRFDDLSGLLWDRDALVVIGDPAWSVRLPEGDLPWYADVNRDGDLLLIDVHVRRDLTDRPTPAIVLDDRIVPGRVIESSGLDPVVLDDLVFLPGLRDRRPGSTATVIIEAPLADPIRECSDLDAATRDAVLQSVPSSTRSRLSHVLDAAGDNAVELAAALDAVPAEHRGSMVHLVANLPPRDARELPASFLLEQVSLAHESFEGSPWHDGVPEDVFLDAVLPHANIDERRDDWRRDFVERFRELAWSAPTQQDAVRTLNREIFGRLGIVFDANKRLTNEQSPYQSTLQGCASCTGMSILLANACRAAGIPARLAGIPEWPTGDNHTWVEVFDPADGRWHWIEAYGDGGYDEGWWVDKVREIAASDPLDRRHRIWAAGWTRPDGVPDRMPLWWLDETDDPVPGVDRTAAYAGE
jgi:transglutaminase-like putative cysteine protease